MIATSFVTFLNVTYAFITFVIYYLSIPVIQLTLESSQWRQLCEIPIHYVNSLQYNLFSANTVYIIKPNLSNTFSIKSPRTVGLAVIAL